jgi:hypothetical protein
MSAQCRNDRAFSKREKTSAGAPAYRPATLGRAACPRRQINSRSPPHGYEVLKFLAQARSQEVVRRPRLAAQRTRSRRRVAGRCRSIEREVFRREQEGHQAEALSDRRRRGVSPTLGHGQAVSANHADPDAWCKFGLVGSGDHCAIVCRAPWFAPRHGLGLSAKASGSGRARFLDPRVGCRLELRGQHRCIRSRARARKSHVETRPSLAKGRRSCRWPGGTA